MADSSKPQPLPGGASSDNKESVKREEDLESVPLQVAAQLEPGKSSTSSLAQGRATQQMNEEETTDVGDSGRVRESGLTSCASGREMPNAEGDATSAACRPITVRNGLKIKQKDHQLPFICFTYALSPFTKEPVSIDWRIIVNDEVASQHFRCHLYQLDDNLSELVPTFRKANAKAIVLVNSEENFTFASKFETGLDKSSYPIVILTKSDGTRLVELLDNAYGQTEIYARLEKEPQEEVNVQPTDDQNEQGFCEVNSFTQVDKEGKKPEGFLRRIFGMSNKPSIDLKSEVEKIMFLADDDVITMSEDSSKFAAVMSVLTVYERQVRPRGGGSDVAELFQMIKTHLRSTFKQDFPFYILLAYRTHVKMSSFYECEQVQSFVSGCICKFEEMDIKTIARQTLPYIEKGDFKVTFPDDDGYADESVFYRLGYACLELADVSYNLNMKLKADKQTRGRGTESQKLYPGFVHARMLWLSLALKFHEKEPSLTRQTADRAWRKYLLNYSKDIVLDGDTIQDLERGLMFGGLLKLPARITFNSPQMHDLLLGTKKLPSMMRPLSHVERYIRAVEGYIRNESHMVDFLGIIRSRYAIWLKPSRTTNLISASTEKTLSCAIREGISLVDCIHDVCTSRKLESIQMESECYSWIRLLIECVDFTSSLAETHLRRFVINRSELFKSKKCQREVRKCIRETSQRHFPDMSIEQVCSLFSAFNVYPAGTVKDFLSSYVISQKICICDPTWQKFIEVVVDRFIGAENHFFLCSFMEAVGRKYVEDKRSPLFLVDLLQLKVPKLFALEDTNVTGDTTPSEVPRKFSSFIRSYINSNALKSHLLMQMTAILEHISKEHDEFQQLILDVLKTEVIPGVSGLPIENKSSWSQFELVLKKAVYSLCNALAKSENVTQEQNFFWGLVVSCCSRIDINNDDLEWIRRYNSVLILIGSIFKFYCSKLNLSNTKCIIIEHSPEQVAEHPLEDLRKYFQWIAVIQTFLKMWKDKLTQEKATYDEMLMYEKNYYFIHSLGEITCSMSLMCFDELLHQMLSQFREQYEILNILLIKYIYVSDKTVLRWCTLPSLLLEYDVILPCQVQEMLNKYVLLPGEKDRFGVKQLATSITPSTTGHFQPGDEVCLKLSNLTSLNCLIKLVIELTTFQSQLLDHLEAIVFFKLHKSTLFDKYLRVQIARECDKLYLTSHTSTPLSDLPFSLPTLPHILPQIQEHKEEVRGLPMGVFVASVERTRDLISKLLRGDAEYYEISAEEKLNFESLDVKKEFQLLEQYAVENNMTCSGLSGVQHMLELFQYCNHVCNIEGVCSQYKLDGCLNDERLHKLTELISDLDSDSRRKLTLNEASRRMLDVKETLCLSKDSRTNCLHLFALVRDSADFYNFIQNKQFYGKNGVSNFYQQCELITAQLQHEEYNEQVLNHLYAAFKLITPFLDRKQDLKALMSKVKALDVTNGLKQLRTVNANIHLIQLWFSRAEGDTLQNVARDLDRIVSSGYYTFTLVRDSMGSMSTQIILEYEPSSLFHQQPESLETATQQSDDASNTSSPSSVSESSPSKNGMHQIKLESEDFSSLAEKQSTIETWNTEQVGDFVRKLGFFEKEKDSEGGEKIKHFLRVNEVAYKILDLYVKLHELGHIEYINEGEVGPPLHCSVSTETAEETVAQIEAKLTSWRKEVKDLLNKFEWLHFFSVPKLLRMSQLLCQEHEDTDCHIRRVVHEISFLCKNDSVTRTKMYGEVQETIKMCKKTIRKTDPPIYAVGLFLHHLFDGHSLPCRSWIISPVRPQIMPSLSSSSAFNFVQILHFCPAYTQDRLIQVIFSIYSGVPESFEVFRCRPTTNEEELNLFFHRISKYPRHYLVLEVNRLPYMLQENLMKFYVYFQKPSYMQSQNTSTSELGTSTIHFVETEPSILREMPWIQLKEYKDPTLTFAEAQDRFLNIITSTTDFKCIQLVYGYAGDGKTHYIKSQLRNTDSSVTIAVNEAFTPVKAITKLRSLPLEKEECGIFFNFTMLHPGDMVDENEKKRYSDLIDLIGWFFFDLFILGYIEDPVTGESFRLHGELKWAVYIEVPSREHDMCPEDALTLFINDIPVLGLIGSKHLIEKDEPYSIDGDAQLVCKYLKAYKIGGRRGIDKLYREHGPPVKFSNQLDLTIKECNDLLQEFMPKHAKRTKITQKLFIMYMKRRCYFLDNVPGYYCNPGFGEYVKDSEGGFVLDEHGQRMKYDTRQLGSILLSTMLKEVEDFCDPDVKDNWSHKPHQQLIYDFKDGGGSLGLITLHPEEISEEDKHRFITIGVEMPSMMKLCNRGTLDGLLSRALNVELDDRKHITAIDDSAYVLTLDYTLKMLNIHEHYECGIPVIIEGETGVGKTALVEMLSKLWNEAILLKWRRKRSTIIDFVVQVLGDTEATVSQTYQDCLQIVENISSNATEVNKDDLVILCQLPDGSEGKLFSQLLEKLLPLKKDPMVPLLTITDNDCDSTFEALFNDAEPNHDPESTAALLHAILTAQLKPTFHKINVHAAMMPADIEDCLRPAFKQAKDLKDKFITKASDKVQAVSPVPTNSSDGQCTTSVDTDSEVHSYVSDSLGSAITSPSTDTKKTAPFVTVFIDEVNTSSCLGLFKELIVDKTFDGEPIPDNMFIVAACNPHRGNSLATHMNDKELDEWFRGTYYVRRLHPTLEFLKWDYGSLDVSQERDYVNSKMKMLNRKMPDAKVGNLADLIVNSQSCMREYAQEHLLSKINDSNLIKEAELCSRSCVSQRDIQRVFTIYEWLMGTYKNEQRCLNSDPEDRDRRAVLVALGVVYYMRLNDKYRTKYEEMLNKQPGTVKFTFAFGEELDWYIKKVDLPKGIAHTRALKENLFATIVCTITHTPLIIVGAPGSSKTLSFNQTIANLKGSESKHKFFKIFCALDPHYYQCSRRTTSNEIEKVFSRAINRQRSHCNFNAPVRCVVFMDEAGLPEESHESLKILHYHLDKQEVSFVAITNHVLDAAKTNRAVTLFRPEAKDDDLKTLATGCFCSSQERLHNQNTPDLEQVEKFCAPYGTLMEENISFATFFGLRDFIHFVNYLRRNKDMGKVLSSEIIMRALERNFNGCKAPLFEVVCRRFFEAIGVSLEQVQGHGMLDIIRDSLKDRPQDQQDITENEVRYKLIIDPSEDDSLVRQLFSFGVIKRENTRLFVCSDFPGDGQIQKINTIAAIRHSAGEGHTVIMSQTDDIHESFYDLFNQRFRCIDDPKKGPRYYTNISIGAHLKPSRVHPNFQCVVVMKESELRRTPAPFLNRFEKYRITYSCLLETAFTQLRPCMEIVIKAAIEKVKEFLQCVNDGSSLYGLQEETLESLILSVLPLVEHKYELLQVPEEDVDHGTDDIRTYVITKLIKSLRLCGFYITPMTNEEVEQDAHHLFSIVQCDPVFEGLMSSLEHQQAAKAVVETINMLITAQKPVDQMPFNLSPEGCLMSYLLRQWLVRYLCKKLMQLMTSEALILNRRKIPFSYLFNYLTCQNHFSLKDLIDRYYNALEIMDWNLSVCPNKVLCFTRSSQLVHQLPTQFKAYTLNLQHSKNVLLQDIVFEETEKLLICKLTNAVSQAAFQDLLKEFIHSDKKVCVIIANMQETSRHIINHVRIMIEEAEILTPDETKLFVLLLHFPPAHLSTPCYPSLFLKGWDHYYLDTIAQSTTGGEIDIRDWIWQCSCITSGNEQESIKDDSLSRALTDMLPEVIPILCSRVSFGTRKGGSFSAPMNSSNRSKILKELLFDRGVGPVLCKQFRSYWKPLVMAEMLDRAAAFSKNRESTLNITDSIQTMFKSLFFDFVVYMIFLMNNQFNIDILFDKDRSPAVGALFLDILQVFPLPSLSQVHVLSMNIQESRHVSHVPRFPFFMHVSSSIEKILKRSQEEANKKIRIFECKEENDTVDEDNASTPVLKQYDKTLILSVLQKEFFYQIEEQEKEAKMSSTVLALEAMNKHPEIWHRYFRDFIFHKMNLDAIEPGEEGIAETVLGKHFEGIHSQAHDTRQKIVVLHTYVHVYHLDLSKMAGMFKSLDKLHGVSKTLALSPSPSSPLDTFFLCEHYPIGTPQHVSAFVIDILFSALVSAVYHTKDISSTCENISLWFKVYRNIMALPTLKKYVYQALEYNPDDRKTHIVSIEAKFNTLHTTYLILLTKPSLDEDLISNGQKVFQSLFSRYFTEDHELQSECDSPRLCNISTLAVEMLNSADCGALEENVIYSNFMESLFAHFFSPCRQGFHSEDVEWFLELANKQEQWRAHLFDDNTEVVIQDDLPGETDHDINTDRQLDSTNLHLNIFKLHLGRILGECPKDVGKQSYKYDPLGLYKHEPRSAIAKVLISAQHIGVPGPYIPVFYQECPSLKIRANTDNAIMQQPLAHLYFITVLEHLVSRKWEINWFVMSASSIRELCNSPDIEESDKIMLWIELQAVVQVIAQNVPYHLQPSQRDNIVQFAPLKDDVNRLLDESREACPGHAMVVALHLYKLLKSSRKFTELMTTKFNETIKEVNCLKPIKDQFESQLEPTPHLFPFMLPEANGKQASLYRSVFKAMYDIHTNEGDETALISIPQEWSHDPEATTSPSVKLLSFRMMIWLVTYYKFYEKKVRSTHLCNIIGGQAMSSFLQEEGYVRIIQCFLNPELMLKCPESPNPLADDEEVLELHGRGHRPTKRSAQTKEDPLHALFFRTNESKQDRSDEDLRHSIANMVAMVMGLPSRSNHLWYHMFAADELVNTYMTGFMYDARIDREGLLYDCGVELTPDGKFGRQDYMKHASRGTYTLHSLYLLLWANFGAFSIALLTHDQTGSDSKIHGNIISDWISVRHYCVSQLRTLWVHMRNNLGLSEEERTFFVMRAMEKFYELFSPQDASRKGYFTSKDDLDKYELSWHLSVYQPAWNELTSKFDHYSQYWQSELFLQMRQLDLHYPHFPSENNFIHQILKSDDLQEHFESGRLVLLSRFSMEWPRLKVGGLLLPRLVKFYQWLHTQLACLITNKKAATLSIGRVVELASKRYNKSMGKELLDLYEFVKTNYNQYIEQIGGAIGAGACAAIKRGDKVYTIEDDVPVLHFLSDVEEEGEGNDWLFNVIDDIVSAHNLVIGSLHSSVFTNGQSILAQQLPDEHTRYIMEMDETNCLVGDVTSLHGISDFLQIIRSRYLPHLNSQAQGPRQITLSISDQPKKPSTFQLIQLEKDIITCYIAGKPLINQAGFRTIFKFKPSLKTADVIPPNITLSSWDLQEITKDLPDTFKKQMDDTVLKGFEYGFHCASYHIMIEVIIGLRSVVDHLRKEFVGQLQPRQELEKMTVSQFMLEHYEGTSDQKEHEVLNEIGITSLNSTQFHCLIQLPLTCSIDCMLNLATWVEEGLYEFSSLPFPLKVHMSDDDRIAIEELGEKWTGSTGDLISEVKQLIDVLKHSERDITKEVNQNSQKPIIEYLIDYHMLSSGDKLAKLIPQTVILRHYVSFRQALKRLRLKLQSSFEKQNSVVEQNIQGRWTEVVYDSWRTQQTSVQQEDYLNNDGMFTYDPKTGLYGFEKGSYDTEHKLMTDLMNEPEPTRSVEDFDEDGDGDDSDDGKDHSGEPPESELEPIFSHSYDLDQASDVDEEKEDDVNKEFQGSLPSIEEKCLSVSVRDVANFLASIQLNKYAKKFTDENIDGSILIELNSEGLSQLGVDNALDQLKILVGFQLHLKTGDVQFSPSKLINALRGGELECHSEKFEEHRIDGELLLYTEKMLVRRMLTDIGITCNLTCAKIISRFRKYKNKQ